MSSQPQASTSSNVGLGPGLVTDDSLMVDEQTNLLAGASESFPLLPTGPSTVKKPWYRARPLWLLPFAVLVAICRGMTLAPRVQVFTQLACDLVAPVQNISLILPPSSPSKELPNPDFVNVTFQQDATTYISHRMPYTQCLKDPLVQSKASKLQTVLMTTMGILSAITTGWWGRFSEKHGRLTVLSFSTVGLLVTDLIFFILAIDSLDSPKHRQLFLLGAPILDGLFGGYNTVQATVTSYISDCTSDGSRANIFSRFHGVFFIGIAVGPEIGALLIRLTGGVSAVFLVSSCMLVTNFLLLCFVLPESLSKTRRKELRLKHDTEPVQTGFRRLTSYPVALVTPLRVFLPRKRADSKHWDWSFIALAGAFFCSFLAVGMYSTKYLYADHIYSWDAEKLSYFITGIGTARALHLLVILPYILRMVKKPITPAMRASPNYPEILAREMHFDLLIAKCSLLLDVLANLMVVAVDPAHEALFIVASFMTSFGGGVNPSLQSLSLCLSQSYEEKVGTGEILGAISFLMAIGSWIAGPILFGLTYSATVAYAPKTIYLIGAILCGLAFVSVSFVRPYRRMKAVLWAREQEGRGRSRTSKDLSVPRSENA